MKIFKLAVLAFVTFLSTTCSLLADKRVALVIGNSDYDHVPRLANPEFDSEDISGALRRIGFDVTLARNLDYSQMRIALRDFAHLAASADIVLIYFAGHGIEIGNVSYLIPTNAELRSDRDVEFEAVQLDAVIRSIADIQGLKIVLVDACRTNPFPNDMVRTNSTRSLGRGLGRVDPGGVLVGYAARAGTVALDGEVRNSPYAQALLKYIEEPGLELGKLFRKVRDTVFDLTDGYQEPFTYGSLPGKDIFLVPGIEPAAMIAPDVQITGKPPPTREGIMAAAMKVNSMRGWSLLAQKLRASAIAEPDVLLRMEQILPNWNTDTKQNRLRAVETFLLPDREAKKQLQEALNSAGYNVGTPDGAIGPITRSGIRQLQDARGLESTGIVDPALLASLGSLWPALSNDEFVSNPFAMSQDTEALELLGESEEIVSVLKCLGRRRSIYGKSGESFYIAVVGGLGGSVLIARRQATKCGVDLASITSRAENEFLVRMTSSDTTFFNVGYDSKYNVSYKGGPYFGLRKDPQEQSATRGWRWYSGEPVSYTNWLPSKPNSSHGRGKKAFAQFQYEARGRRDLTNAVASQWFDGSGAYAPSILLEGRLP